MSLFVMALLCFWAAAAPPANAQAAAPSIGSDVAALFAAGDAALAAGSTSEAMVYYLRAESFVPRDPALRERIAWARYLLGAPLNRLPPLLALDYTLRPWFTLSELGTAAWLLFCIVCAGAVPVLRRATLPALFRYAVGLLLVVSLCVMLVYAARLVAAFRSPFGVSVTPAQLYSGPATSYLPLGNISGGRELYIVQQRAGWAQILTVDGLQGWLNADEVVVVNQTGTEAE